MSEEVAQHIPDDATQVIAKIYSLDDLRYRYNFQRQHMPQLVNHLRKNIELHQANRQNSASVLNIFGIVEKEDHFVVFMEFCENGSLGQFLYRRQGEIEAELFLDLCAQLLRAFAELAAGDSHYRFEIRLDAILVDQNLKVRLADFGGTGIINGMRRMAAKSLNQISQTPPQYFQVVMKHISSYSFEKSSVWSLGVLFY